MKVSDFQVGDYILYTFINDSNIHMYISQVCEIEKPFNGQVEITIRDYYDFQSNRTTQRGFILYESDINHWTLLEKFSGTFCLDDIRTKYPEYFI